MLRKYQPNENEKIEIIVIHNNHKTTYIYDDKLLVVFFERDVSQEEKEKFLRELIAQMSIN